MGGRTLLKRSQSQACSSPAIARGKPSEDAACRRAVEAFFNCLDRSCGGDGYIDEALALRVWPLLTRHVDGQRVRMLERQLRKRVDPISRNEWLALMDIVCNIGGMRLFMSSILNTWVLLEEGKLREDPLEQTNGFLPLKASLPPLWPSADVSLCGSSERSQQSEPRRRHAKKVSNEAALQKSSVVNERIPHCDTCGQANSDTEELFSKREKIQHIEGQLVQDASSCNPLVISSSSGPGCPSGTAEGDAFDLGTAIISSPSSAEGVRQCEGTTDVVGDAIAASVASESYSSTSLSVAPSGGQFQVLPKFGSSESMPQLLTDLQAAMPVTPSRRLPNEIDKHVDTQDDHVPPSDATPATASIGLLNEMDKCLDHADDPVPPPDALFPIAAGTSPTMNGEENAVAECLQLPGEEPPTLEDASEVAARRKVADCPQVPDEEPPTLEDASEVAPDEQVLHKRPGSRCKEDSSKRRVTPKRMRQSASQPSLPPVRVASLPPLPKVRIAVTNIVRLAHAVENWRAQHFMYHRVGNVVQAHKDILVGAGEIKAGQRGRIVHVTPEVSVDILLDGHTAVTQVPRSDLANFDLRVVTHEVELIDSLGQRSGKFLACMVVKDHEDGFYNILCQDGREQQFVHSAYMRELSTGMYTDVGYLSARSHSSASRHTSPDEKLGHVLRSAPGFELPPEGFIGTGRPVGFAGVSALAVPRHRGHGSKHLEESRREEAGHIQARSSSDWTSMELGSSVCPFMEIQEGGLRAFMAISNFTVDDVVIDIGCGYGKILNKILECCPCQGIGVEVNPSIARVAEEKLRRYAGRARVVMDDVRNVDLQEATATVSYLLSHSFDAKTGNGAALKEHLSKNLRPGCVVLNYTYPVLGWNGSLQNGVYKYIIGEHLLGQ